MAIVEGRSPTFETVLRRLIGCIYFFKCGIKTKTHFEWLLWHWSSLGQLNLEPTRPNGLVGCKVPTDLVKISVKEATHMGFHYIMKEYRGPTLRPPCDAIDDVIIMKNAFFCTIRDDFFISEVKLKLCLIFQNLKNGRHFELATNILPEVIPEVVYTRKVAMSISDILSFWSTL